jgi:hypothetical protein
LLHAFIVVEPGSRYSRATGASHPAFPVQSRIHCLLAAHVINIPLARTMPHFTPIFATLCATMDYNFSSHKNSPDSHGQAAYSCILLTSPLVSFNHLASFQPHSGKTINAASKNCPSPSYFH